MDWADLVGISGFVLSCILAISQLISNRLEIQLKECTVIDTEDPRNEKNFVFFHVCLSNKTKVPFSLVDVLIDDGTKREPIPIDKSAFIYPPTDDARKPISKPVLLSPWFPVRFDSYAAELLLLKVDRHYIEMNTFRPDGSPCTRKRRIQLQFPHIRRLCTHRSQPCLILQTTRGKRVLDLAVDALETDEYLEKLGYRKAVHEDKI